MCTGRVYILLHTLCVYRGVCIGGTCIGAWVCIYMYNTKNLRQFLTIYKKNSTIWKCLEEHIKRRYFLSPR